MNFELLEKIHQIHQDLTVCKEVGDGDTVEILRVYEKGKVDHELLKDIHDLYYHGHLHLPDYCHVFGYSKVNGLRNLFKKRNLPTLSAKSVRQLYGDKIEDKFKQTNIQKFGKEYPSQSIEVQKKWRQTNLERYGHEYGFQSSEIQEKIKQTNLERFGHPYASQSEEIQKRIKQTSVERFGCSHWFQNHDIKENIKQTNLERFGHPYASQSPIIREKWKQTNLSKYGFEYPIQSPEIQEKTKQTNLERYGVENPSQSPVIKERVKQTNLERYGFACSLQSPEVKEKSKQTNIERYGFEYATQSPEIRQKLSQRLKSEEVRDKFKRTNLERYGYPYASQSPEIQEKIKSTNLERYGYPYASQSPEILGRVKETNIQRYGYPYASQSPEIQEKIKSTNLERYGYPYASQSPEIQEKIKSTNLERYGYPYASQSPEIQEKIKSTRKINDWRYAKLVELVEFEPDKATQFVLGNYTNQSKVLKRYGLYQENLSTPEAAIREILEKHKIEYLFQHRPKFLNRKELDFFIPNRRASNNPVSGNSAIAIEVNGLYWHSTKFRNKFYHQDKHLRCRSEGIQLLSFTEDQILEKLEIIESMILHKLGKTPYRLYAKNCDIVKIDHKKAKDFLEKNHLHGFSNASVYLGLEYQGKLVHVMSFGNNRFKKSNHPELIRSASLRFHSVAGGFQRLLKYYKRSHGVDLIESYVDFNISNGQSYELASKDLGYLTDGDNLTEPDLWFVYHNKRYRRQSFMKHNLHKIFKDFPVRGDQGYDQITVREYLKDRGVLEYYGAGNLRYLI